MAIASQPAQARWARSLEVVGKKPGHRAPIGQSFVARPKAKLADTKCEVSYAQERAEARREKQRRRQVAWVYLPRSYGNNVDKAAARLFNAGIAQVPGLVEAFRKVWRYESGQPMPATTARLISAAAVRCVRWREL